MKNFVFLVAALLMGTGSAQAAPEMNLASTMTNFGYSNSFIFVDNGVSFAVYPDGELDFYVNNPAGVQVGVGFGTTAVTFNSGFNYNPYVQYDDFGAVVQVRNVPIFYDYYGRVNRIGNVFISYRNGRLFRFGGMRVYYNHLGYYNYHVGYINPFNRYYVYRPFHQYFVRPAVGYCMVFPQPYRRYYHPVRYTYHRPYHHNVRRAYARVGQTQKYQNRAERSRIYRNDNRVVARSSGRNGDLVRNSRVSDSRNIRRSSHSGRSATAQRVETGRKELHRGSRRVERREGTSAIERSSRVATRKTTDVRRSPKRQGITRSTARRTNKATPAGKIRERDSRSRMASVARGEKRRTTKTAKGNSRDTRERTGRRNPR